MNAAATAFIVEAPTLGLGGFLLGRFLYGTSRGKLMHTRIKHGVGSALDWIGEGRKLPAAIVAVIFLVLAGFGYTYQSSQASADDVSRLVDCITFYSHYTSAVQKDRGAAATKVQHELGEWIGNSTNVNRAKYLRSLDDYLQTTTSKPFRLFDREFCMDYQANRIDK